MGEPPCDILATTSLSVERVVAGPELRWRHLRQGLAPDRIRADLRAGVCGKQVLFPAVHYGFAFEPRSTISLKACLQALVARREHTPHAWREGHGGVHTHLLNLDGDPTERFEFFVFDDRSLYFAYHSNQGGMLALELLLSLSTLIALEGEATESLARQLDQRIDTAADEEERHRYLGRWEGLKAAAAEMSGSLTALFPGFEEPLF